MQGLHLTADLTGCKCDAGWLTNAEKLGQQCLVLIGTAGLRAVEQATYSFAPSASGPGGVTATVLLAESHLCIHTWPELHAVTLDIYVCNLRSDHSTKARQLLDGLLEQFKPRDVEINTLHRGKALRMPHGADTKICRGDAPNHPTS